MTDNEPNIAAPGGRRAEARRQQVIDTARLLFSDNGFHATGIAQVAKQSGVAVGQIYRDFASKEDIVAAIVAADCANFMAAESLKEAVERGDRNSVRDWVHSFVDPQSRDADGRMFAEILAESSRNERIAAIFAGVQSEARANMLTALGLLAPGDAMAARRLILAETILALSLGLMQHGVMNPGRDLDDLVAALTRIVDREIDDLDQACPGPSASSPTPSSR